MKPLKRILFYGVLPTTIITIFFSLSTQVLARSLAYQRQLGQPALRFKAVPIYNPFHIIPWYFHFHRYAAKEFREALLFSYAGGAIALAMIVIFAISSKEKKVPISHGSACWANEEDVEKAQLLSGKGVVLGVEKDGR